MKEISAKTIILPLLLVLGAIIVVAVFSVMSINNVKQECNQAVDALASCRQDLAAKNDTLNDTREELRTLRQDLSKYDNLYEQTSEEKQNLTKELEEEKQKDKVTYNVPYRSVPTYDAFSKGVKLELMLERNRLADQLLENDHVREDELRRALGELFLISWEFRRLFREDGVMDPLNEEAAELYRRNNEHYDELDNYYNNFDEMKRQKLETRLDQIAMTQQNVIKGMQNVYFLR